MITIASSRFFAAVKNEIQILKENKTPEDGNDYQNGNQKRPLVLSGKRKTFSAGIEQQKNEYPPIDQNRRQKYPVNFVHDLKSPSKSNVPLPVETKDIRKKMKTPEVISRKTEQSIIFFLCISFAFVYFLLTLYTDSNRKPDTPSDLSEMKT